jgi:leucyl aminopeptidase
VTLLVSDKVPADELGIFANAFHLTNYEYSHKTAPKIDKEEDEKARAEADFDERTRKHGKVIPKVQIVNKDGDISEGGFWNVAAKATKYARDLTNTRGSIATPDYMEEEVRKLVKDQASIKDFRIIKGQQLVDLGMNLFHNVGKGATSEPRCVTILYQGNPESKDIDIAFVGKGLTFDTGGLNLKPTGSIEDMYYDKAGACAVMGALKGALELGIKKNVVFAMGFAENAIDNKSYKPMDIIKSMKGITVEIGNTDAEGRLVLADTLTYVQ